MDYVIGSVAALISGNVTPNRPKLLRRALTPTKHQASPNVTPKSEFVDDRSIFLSPTQQKKKAIVKKSPKRIFENPDLDITEDSEGNSSLASPKAEKVKKHLQVELEADMGRKKSSDPKSPSKKLEKSSDEISPMKKSKILEVSNVTNKTPKKKNKKRNSESKVTETDSIAIPDRTEIENVEIPNITTSDKIKSPKKKMQRRKSVSDVTNTQDTQLDTADSKSPNIHLKSKSTDNNPVENKMQEVGNKKKNKKRKKKNKIVMEESNVDNVANSENKLDPDASQPDEPDRKKKKKNRKNKSKQATEIETEKDETKTEEPEKMEVEERADASESDDEETKSKNIPNPNAITEKDSDSEHDSDDEMESENEETKLTNENDAEPNPSSDEEEKEPQSKKKKEKTSEEKGKEVVVTEEEIKRTLFVGNVLFSAKCKKEIKKIFNKYGQIETIRIRAIPVKDGRATPKLAVIKNELHPERTTVNVYIKYADPVSVSKAIDENNTVLNGHHLRVSRSASTGAEHDPHCAVFVGNLPFAVEDETLRSKFDKCGEIQSVRIIRDKKTNAGKGFGYVNFTSKDAVELALALSEEDLTIKNRIIRVKRCTQGQSQGKRLGGAGQPPRGGGKWNQRGPREDVGAARRILHKRKQQDGGEGPPHKRQFTPQPGKEKKARKEFVGMTSEKKKKPKFDKGQKKRKALSEILMKKA